MNPRKIIFFRNSTFRPLFAIHLLFQSNDTYHFYCLRRLCFTGVCLSTGEGLHPGGESAFKGGGLHWWGGSASKGEGALHPRRVCIRGVCIQEEGVSIQAGLGRHPPSDTTGYASTSGAVLHPTGMHSCFVFVFNVFHFLVSIHVQTSYRLQSVPFASAITE